MKLSYEAVGHGVVAPTRRYVKRRCRYYPTGRDNCELSLRMYKCLVEFSGTINPVYIQFFKDAYHGKINAW